MEYSGDEGFLDDTSRARSHVYGNQAKQASVGSDCDENEGKGLQSKRRAVQVQVEKPRHSIQGSNLFKTLHSIPFQHSIN